MKRESLYDENWKQLSYFPNQTIAAMVLQVLEAEDIPAYKFDGNIGVHLPGLGGTKIFVRACDLDKAGKLLKELEEAGVTEN